MLVSICDGDPISESHRIGRDTSHELDLHATLLLAVAPSRLSTAVLVGDYDSGLCALRPWPIKKMPHGDVARCCLAAPQD
jgi:hypothetical protein